MASYALRTDAGPVELSPGQDVVSRGTGFSYATMAAWSDEERASHGIFTVSEPDPPPSGKIAIGSTLNDDGTTIRRVWTLADAPPFNPRGLIATMSGAVDSDGGVAVAENASGIGAAMELEPGVYWFFFNQPLPDAAYIVTPGYCDPTITFDLKVTSQNPDYFEVTTLDRVTGSPGRPANVSSTVYR